MKKTVFLLFTFWAFAVSLTVNADPAYYLIGEFNKWNEEAMIPFVAQNDGSFVLTRTLKGAFKVKDEAGNWYGGYTGNDTYYWLTPENPSVTLCDGANLFLNGESATYTLTIANGVLTATGFGTPPTPRTPEEWMLDWYDCSPDFNEDGSYMLPSAWFYIDYGQDFMGNLVADDYTFELDTCMTHEEPTYTILDPMKFSYSIYTDYNKLFVFDPAVYSEFTEPTTEVFPFHLFNYNDPATEDDDDGYVSTTNFEYWGPHFPGLTNQVEAFAEHGMEVEPFFKYRIGIQIHYTVDGVTKSSGIAWWGELPPNIKGDVNFDGKVDVTDVNILVNIILGKDSADKYDGRAYITDGDTNVDVSDVNEEVNILLGKTSK